MTENLSLGASFDSNAELYEIARPKYPDALFDALIEATGLNIDARLLEIGIGTGQATVTFAKRGYCITAIEPRVNLAEVARQKLSKYERVRVITGDYENVDLPLGSFDLIYAATSFHWIKPEVRFKKSHDLLRSKGHLAIIQTNHVSDEQGDKFFFESQPIYKKCEPGGSHDESFRLPLNSELKHEKIDDKLFDLVYFSSFPLFVSYSAKEYVELLATFSPTISMEPHRRIEFLRSIRQLIDDRFDGTILKRYAMTLTIARKKNLNLIQ